MAKEIQVVESQCPCCLATLGIQEDNLQLHFIAPGLFNGRKVQVVEATPEWKLNNYFFNQGGRPHRQDIEATTVASSESGSTTPPEEEESDPLTSARLKEALAKDLIARNIPNPTTTTD